MPLYTDFTICDDLAIKTLRLGAFWSKFFNRPEISFLQNFLYPFLCPLHVGFLKVHWLIDLNIAAPKPSTTQSWLLAPDAFIHILNM